MVKIYGSRIISNINNYGWFREDINILTYYFFFAIIFKLRPTLIIVSHTTIFAMSG